MDLQTLFYPKSIAIIGASSREKTVGNDVVKNLVKQGYEGKILPINPKITELYGLEVYADISDVNQEIDLVIVAIPAAIVSENLKKAAKKGAKAAAVISAGFKEVGEIELEKELQKVCQENNITLIGPNCLGVINPEIKMNASFAHVMPRLGSVAFISQSGALCTAVLDYAQELKIGFSKFLSIGNKAAVDELKLIKYLAQDEQTKVILVYSEEMADAPAFIKTLKEINKGPNPKPVIVLKSGRTEAGASAIASHTGSLAGGDNAYQALFDQAGIIRAGSIQELFDLAQVFSRSKLTSLKNTAIITNAGGPGVLTTDELTANGLQLAKVSAATEKKLKDFLPPAASVSNPIDVLGDAQADRYQFVLKELVEDQAVDSIILILTPQSMTQIEKTAQVVIDAKKDTDKPIVASFMGAETVKPGMNLMNQAGVATTTFPEPGAKSLSALAKFVSWHSQKTDQLLFFDDVDRDRVRQIFDQARTANKTSFPEAEALEIMKAYNFPILLHQVAKSSSQALDIAKQIGGKLAMKIVSQDILHKSDVGGVMLNVSSDDVVVKYNEMMSEVANNQPEAKLEGVLLMEMAPQDGIEVVMGVNKVPGLGSMIMFGLGGVYVELLKDVKFAFAPLTNCEALSMISGLKTSQLFEGYRGQEPRDKEKIIECIGRLSQLVSDFPEIKELDINPLLSLPQGKGAKVLDARIIIE
jgi:acetyltransferase